MRLSYLIVGVLAVSVQVGWSQVEPDSRDPDIRQIMKMSPSDVLRLRGAANNHEVASYKEMREPQVLSEEVALELSPGEQVRDVSILQRAPTTISFVDATGTAWPIKEAIAYDGELFGIKPVENEFRNSVVLHGKLPAGSSYITVFLEGLASPITVRVTVSQATYHRSIAFKLMKVGPETKVTHQTLETVNEIGLPPDPDLNNILFGVTPFGAVKLETDNSNVLAWKKGDDVLVRTSLHVFSPPHIRIKPSTNGYIAYRLPRTSRLNASNDAGAVIKVSLTERMSRE